MKYTLKYDIDKTNILEDLLKKKGIENPDLYINIENFQEHDPYLLKNIEAGCRLLIDHLKKGSKIYLQPDSDMDGYMSSTMLFNYIKITFPEANIIWQVHEGKQHGVILQYVPQDCALAIYPDAGSNNYKEHKILKEMGIDVLVIDHHQCEYESEDAIVVNNQIGEYPNKYLSGGGVVYKFLQVMDKLLEIKESQNFIDQAAISIVGDMMDLRQYENRLIVKKGLSNIRNLGLKQLIAQQAFSLKDTENLTPIGVAFYIVPLVNALIRVGTQKEKELLFRAFTEGHLLIPSTKRGDKGNFETVAVQAVRNCVNARSRQNRAKDKAIEDLDLKIQKNELFRNQIIFVNVEDNEMFDSTLTGLIAMNFLAKYKKPTIVARLSDDNCWKGSGRGSNSTELKDLKSFFAESKLFDFVEGHPNAFGLSIHTDNVERLVEYANDKLRNIQFNENVYEVDIAYNGKEDISEAIFTLGRLQNLWGTGLEEPYIVVEEINLYPEDVSFIGQKSDTVKFTVNGTSFVKFKDLNFVKKIKEMKNGFAITIIGKANINEWNGNYSPQLIIEDYQIRDNSYDF